MQLRIEPLGKSVGPPGRRAVAIGNFDGIHLGHLKLLRACVEEGRQRGLTPTVMTFDPHPATVVSPRGAPARVQTLTSRRRRLTEIGVLELAQLRFDETVARLSPAAFVQQALVQGVEAGCVVVGSGFRFGADRAGDVETLRALGRGHFETVEVPPLEDEGGRVSSSRIREALLRGDLTLAQRWLGRPYEIEGRVLHGDHRGRSLGFPTANVDLEGVSALGHGVYAAEALIEGEAAFRRAAVNLGLRPTFAGVERRLEAHLPGFSGDLYGRAVRLVFLLRLRDERRFDSAGDLAAQLEADVRAAERVPPSAGWVERRP